MIGEGVTHNLYTIGFTPYFTPTRLHTHFRAMPKSKRLFNVQSTCRCNLPCFATVWWHFALSWSHICHQPLLSAGRILVCSTFLVNPNFSHLRYNGQEYDVSWTMPQCVLCLRLIGQLCWLCREVPCYLQWLLFSQWQSFGIMFRPVVGCVWWRETEIEAN